MPIQPGSQLDVTGTCCPLPLMLLAKAMESLTKGQSIEIIGNDPIFESSVRDFCKTNGHTIVKVRPGKKRSVSIIIQVKD